MVEVAAKVAEIEELEELGRTLLRGLDDRLAAHAEVHRRGRRGPPWTCSMQHEETFFADVRGGHICKASAGTAWSLVVYWHDGDSTRVLARGKRRDVDRYAEEVLHYGPPGGPEYTGGDLAWSSWDEEPTLHAATIGGQFRLAPLTDGPHLLMVARNDHRVDVLGLGDSKRLQSTAEEQLHDRRGDSLHLWLGDERVYLQALGFASIVGYVELQRGARLVLGHLEADCFGLFYEAGKVVTCRGIYTLADLRRGDLGRVLVWSTSSDCGVVPASSSQVEVAAPLASSPSESAKPSSSPPPSTPPSPSSPPSEGAKASSAPPENLDTDALPRRPASRRMVSLSPEDVTLVKAHLRCKGEPSGEGCTVKPRVLEGLGGLVALGLGDLLLYARDFQKLFAEQLGLAIHCDAKTITRALRSIEPDTDLVVRVGRRWLFRGGDLQLEDAELLRAIREATPNTTRDGARTFVAKDAPTPPARHLDDAPSIATVGDRIQDNSALPGGASTGGVGHGGAPRSTAPHVHGADDHAPHDAEPREADPRATAPPEEGRFDATPPEAEVADESEPDLQSQDPVSRRSRIQFRIYQPLPADQAASRYVGRKKGRKRDPPER